MTRPSQGKLVLNCLRSACTHTGVGRSTTRPPSCQDCHWGLTAQTASCRFHQISISLTAIFAMAYCPLYHHEHSHLPGPALQRGHQSLCIILKRTFIPLPPEHRHKLLIRTDLLESNLHRPFSQHVQLTKSTCHLS